MGDPTHALVRARQAHPVPRGTYAVASTAESTRGVIAADEVERYDEAVRRLAEAASKVRR